jgi:NADPH:quinone reductase
MCALVSEICGAAETLVMREFPEPRPGSGEVRVAIEACGINYPDVLVIEDRYQSQLERPFAPGFEICGLVESLGPDVVAIKPGQRVLAQLLNGGGLAEKAVVAANRLIPVPGGVSAEIAASVLLTYGTSYHALKDRAALKSRQTLLVLGAAGGVGLAAVALGKLMGATVVAAVSSDKKAEAARTAGADLS